MRLRGTAARGAALATAVLAGVLALAGVPAAPATAAPADAAATVPAAPATDDLPVSVSVTGVSPQVLEPGDDLTVTATLRNDGDEVLDSPRASVRIYRYRMTSRDELARWAASGTSSPIGDVAATTVLDAPLEPGQSQTVQVVVPADDIRLLRTDDAWGPRGITLDVGDGSRRVGVDRTFLLWGSADEVPTAHVGVLAPVVGPATDPGPPDEEQDEDAAPQPSASPTPTPTPTGGGDAEGAQDEAGAEDGVGAEDPANAEEQAADDALTALTASGGRLSRLLQATGSHPAVSWAVDPALVESAAGGSRAAQAWLSAMEAAADGREVLRLPWADPDVAAVAHAGAVHPGSDLLRMALDVTGSGSELLGDDAEPLLWAADDVPDDLTAARAAASAPGVPLVVGPDALPADGSGTPGAPVTVPTDSGPVTALVPDGTLTALLSTPASDEPGVTPATAAQRILAETAVLARSDDADSFVLATTPRDWEPSTALATAQLQALESAPWVETETVADVLAAHVAGESGSGADRAGLPAAERDGTELTPAWVNALAADWRAATEFASVVEEPDALLDGLDADLVAPLAVAWREDPEGRAAAVENARARATARQEGLSVLLNEQFTVISSSAPITVAVRNDLDQAAEVRVELRPHKGCLDTARSDLTTVAPNAETSVTLTLRATANCDVEVDVSLVSATGRELATPATFSARVAPTIESVGTIVIGVLLALALAFGIWRTVRRGQTARRGARVVPDPPPDHPPPDATPTSPSPGRQDPS
jgi:hypothetical protein